MSLAPEKERRSPTKRSPANSQLVSVDTWKDESNLKVNGEPKNRNTGVALEKNRRLAGGPNWPAVFWLGIIHLGLLAAPFCFTWTGLVVAVVLHWLTGGVGVCMGYHRFFTHKSFSTSGPMKSLLACLGGLSGEGGVLYWVANHRQHHAHSDLDQDPHSPGHGGWWSHMVWTMYGLRGRDYVKYILRWAPDIARDPALRFFDRTFIFWHIGAGLVLFGAGYAFGGSALGTSLLVWGMFVRLTAVLHATWFVNSASHMWGYRNYETTDDSRNNWWVALVTYGEGWHNNHHAYPRMARAGHHWWEFDLTFLTIRLLSAVGLVWDVVDGQHQRRKDDKKAA